jgi:hypothetical protein
MATSLVVPSFEGERVRKEWKKKRSSKADERRVGRRALWRRAREVGVRRRTSRMLTVEPAVAGGRAKADWTSGRCSRAAWRSRK